MFGLRNFWDKIRVLYRRLVPRMVQQPRAPVVPSTPRVQPPPAPQVPAPPPPPAGPLDVATIMDTIAKAGRERKLLNIRYNGVTRLVEPYSMRDRGTGPLFYGWCSIHMRIHSFTPVKIEEISITDVSFTPRWEVEF
jgi:hypothetical protein